MDGKRTHRRCRSEGGALAEGAALAQWDVVQSNVSSEGTEYPGTAHVRTVSLDTSASQFMQSLALNEAQDAQQQLASLPADLPALSEQQTKGFSRRSHAALSPRYAGAHGAMDAWREGSEAAVTAGVKRSHESSKGRSAKGAGQQDSKKDSLHQHKHSFTPALPAVDEIKVEDAFDKDDRDDDEDYDSDSMATPTARRSSGSRSRARRGGYNGRSENELLLLDPKRVKRILANRQSAARSKERRMNYTLQLEGKLQSLNQEVDKLNVKIEGLQGQSKVLLQVRTELEQQVESMQFQLSRTSADNQLLIKELFGLQRSLGLPPGVPQSDTASAGSYAVPGVAPGQHQAAHPYNTAVQQYGFQQHGALQQHSQWQQHNGTGGYGEYPGAAAADVSGVEAAQMARNKLHYHHQQHSSRSSNSSFGYQSAADLGDIGKSLSAAAAAAGGVTGMPPLPPNGRSPGMHAAAVGDSNGHTAQVNNQHIPSSAAAAAAGMAAAGGTFSQEHQHARQLANAALSSSEAAGAADALLMDASAVGDDTAMTNVDDLEMLSVLFDDVPVQDTAAAAARPVVSGHPITDHHHHHHQQQQSGYFKGSSAAADNAGNRQLPVAEQTAGSFIPPGAAAVPPQPASVSSFRKPAALVTLGPSQSQPNLSQQHALSLTPGPRSWSSQSSPGTGLAIGATAVPPALVGTRAHGGNHTSSGHMMGHHPRVLCSPAYSDPVGEGFADDVSSGSMGGSLTPSLRHARMSESISAAAGTGAAAAAVPLRQHSLGAGTSGGWQQQQQQVLTAMSPRTPGAGSATAAAAAAAAGSHAFGVGQVVPHSSLHSVDAQHAALAHAGYHQRHSSDISSIATVSSNGTLAAVGSSAAAAAPLADPAKLNFTMGVNPAARHRRSASYGGAVGHHHRSASTGSNTGITGLEGLDRTQQWPLQGLQGPQTSSSTAAAGDAAVAAALASNVGPTSPFQQQRQYISNGSAGSGPASMGHYSSGYARLPHGVDGTDSMANGGSRLSQHRRSCSHAGVYGGAAAGNGDGSQHMDHIHPAALGSAAAAAVEAAAAAAGLPYFSDHGAAAGATAGGAEMHSLVGYGSAHTRLVTTRHAAAPAGVMHI